MLKFTMTVLDITKSVLPVLAEHKDATDQEATKNKTADIPLYNARAQAFRAVKAKIEEVCPIYVQEEDAFFEEVKATHAHTKELFQRSEARVKLARKAFVPQLATDSADDLAAARLQLSDLDELFLERVKHQGFRGSICEDKIALPVLGKAGFEDLNALYLKYRGPAVGRTPKIREARVKIGQHVDRVAAIHAEIELLSRGAQGVASSNDVTDALLALSVEATKVYNAVVNGEGMNSPIASVQSRVTGDATYLEKDIPAFIASAKSKVEKERTNYVKFKAERLAGVKAKAASIDQYRSMSASYASAVKTLATCLDSATKMAKQAPKSVKAKEVVEDIKKQHATLAKQVATLAKGVAKLEKAYPVTMKLVAKAP